MSIIIIIIIIMIMMMMMMMMMTMMMMMMMIIIIRIIRKITTSVIAKVRIDQFGRNNYHKLNIVLQCPSITIDSSPKRSLNQVEINKQIRREPRRLRKRRTKPGFYESRLGV